MKDLTDGGPGRADWRIVAVIAGAFLVLFLVVAVTRSPSADRTGTAGTSTSTVRSPDSTRAGTVPSPTASVPVASTVKSTTLTVAPSTTVVAGDSDNTASVSDGPVAYYMARGFLTAWLDGSTGLAARTTELSNWATADLVAKVADVPPELLPRGPIASMDTISADHLSARVSFRLEDGTKGVVGLVRTGVGWRAMSIDRA